MWISFAEIYKENVYDLLKSDGTAAAAGATNTNTKRENLKIFNDENPYIKGLTSVRVSSAADAYAVINAGLAQVD